MATSLLSPGADHFHRDESFNSITGLNGSGKSNILDSICFVLGITNMTTVRAQNLQVCAPRIPGAACIGTLTN
jgi:AAA15 family ATPase/GTPase